MIGAETSGSMDWQRQLKRMCENIRVCQEVLPHEAAKLPDAIDVAHRLGTKRANETGPEQQLFGSLPGDLDMQYGRRLKAASFSGIKACTLRRI